MKKARTDWEGPESEELTKKKQAVENVQTEEDATRLFETTMAGMFEIANSDGIPIDFKQELDQILSYIPDNVPTVGTSDDIGVTGPSMSPVAQGTGDGLEFFDFTAYNEDERGSKAPPTPDLVQSSSTKTSPGSDADSSHSAASAPDMAHIVDSRAEDELDAMRLSFYGELGGGEAPYYNTTDFKYDGSMPALDQPWAFQLDR